MILMEQVIEAGFRLFFHVVTDRSDLDKVIRRLISGKGYGVEDGLHSNFGLIGGKVALSRTCTGLAFWP